MDKIKINGIKILSPQLRYLSLIYLFMLLVFTLFRIIMLFINNTELQSVEDNVLLVKAMMMGLRFDSVIVCYILFLPLIVFFVCAILRVDFLKGKKLYKGVHIFISSVLLLAMFVSTVDLPYFKYFFQRFSVQAFEWFDSPKFVFKMIVEEISYIGFIFVFIAFGIGFWWIMRKIFNKTIKQTTSENYEYKNYKLKTIITYLIFLVLCFAGSRGRLAEKSPIRVGTAYFSNNAFINQLGLNPNFTLIKSIQEKTSKKNQSLNLMEERKAIAFVEKEYKDMYSNPINERDTVFYKQKTNVVLVIMESMTAVNLKNFNPKSNLTPNLDSLLSNGVSYENVYTAGIHTYNGVYSTLFGMPALMDRHSMKRTIIPKMQGGLASILRQNNYSTHYFTTHDDQFDNIGGFLSANDFQQILSQKHYPSKEVKSTLGVPDHIMFRRAIKEINSYDKTKPFFVTLLTTSNHGPYIFPEGIGLKYKSKTVKNKIIEYADWAIGDFMQKASKEEWFKNTLFVFIADHGKKKTKTTLYPMPLEYHHSPLIFYNPYYLQARKDYNLGLQIDVDEMICSYLGIENRQTMGVAFDLYKRKYAYFSADNKIGVLDKELFYIWDRNGKEYLFKYKKGRRDKKNYINSPTYKSKIKEMKDYAFAMLTYAEKRN